MNILFAYGGTGLLLFNPFHKQELPSKDSCRLLKKLDLCLRLAEVM